MFLILKILILALRPIKMNWIPAAIAAAGALGGSLIQSGSQRRATESRNQQQMKLAEHQHEKNVEMWRMMNKYNAPEAQMKRLKSAGLNPNLVYGSGSAPATTTQMPATHQAPNLETKPGLNLGVGEAIAGGINAYTGVEQTRAQTALLATREEAEAINNYIRETDAIEAGAKRLWMRYGKAEGKDWGDWTGGYSPSVRGRQFDPEVFSQMIEKWTNELDESELNNIYQEARGQFEVERAKFAKKGIDISDDIQWRALMKLINAVGNKLGLEPITLTPE